MFQSSPVRLLPGLALVIAALACGCKKPAENFMPVYTHEPLQSHQQVFHVHGLVVEVKPLEKSITIKHEEIPGYMAGMTMPFEVKETNLLAGIEPGDPVLFRLVITDTYGYIDQIQKTGPKTNAPPTSGPIRLARDVEPLKLGDPLPEYHFTNQFDQPVSTAQFKGNALAIEFLFTRCPFPNFCPLMANNFAAVQTNLLAMTNAPANWSLLTITMDPQFDTPQVLKTYAESHQYDPSHWTFATGKLIDITAIGEQFGLAFWHDDTGSLSHNLRTVVIDASGRVQKVFSGNEWTPEALAAELVKAAGPKASAAPRAPFDIPPPRKLRDE